MIFTRCLPFLLLLLPLISTGGVTQFTHNGPHEAHLMQSDLEFQRNVKKVAEREAVLAQLSTRLKRQDINWNMRNGKGQSLNGKTSIPKLVRAKRGFMEEEFHWSNGTGRIVLRNPQTGFLQRFGNGLDSLTKGMANKMGWGGATKDTPTSSGGVGQVNDVSSINQGASKGFLGGLADRFKSYLSGGQSGNFDEDAKEFCRQFPQNEKCRGGRTPLWNDIREIVHSIDQKVRENIPAIPKLLTKDPMQYVPDYMKNAVNFLKQKWGELSTVARSMISEVCRTRVNCQAQSQNAMNLRQTLRDKLRQFRLLFGVGSEKELEEQFSRVQQVKKALLSRAGLDKEVEPADDGVFDSDTLLTTKQAELMLNELGQGGQTDVVPEPPSRSAKRSAIYFEDEFFQKWDVSSPIPYYFDGSIANYEKTDIRDALREISSKTCIRFAEQGAKPNGYHINYVKINSASFCGLSYIGRTAPANPVYLSFACGEGKGVALHETLHALGAAHEHVRMDRDANIKVDWSNIDPRYYDAFAVSDPKTFTTYGVKYDYGSIMHYRFNSAAINPQKPTMIPLVNEAANLKLLGQRRGLSQNDVLLLNRLYCKPDSCLDANVYCGAWALQGVCTRQGNSVWMTANCRKSCGLC